MKVCLSADTIGFPEGGGHFWAYLNWAQGLRAAGCEVTWLEEAGRKIAPERLPVLFGSLRRRLEDYGFADRVTVVQEGAGCMAHVLPEATPLEEAAGADLLINLRYALNPDVVRRFRRSVLVDIDPGLLQVWIHNGNLQVARHDLYFTIGETVGTTAALFPDAGLEWHYTPPPVSLDCWPASSPRTDESFRTVSNWWAEWFVHGDLSFDNSKRAAFLPYLDMPVRTSQKLELALALSPGEEERAELETHGWSVRRAEDVAGNPAAYQAYVRGAKGEFSCAKPAYIRLQTAWVSDRTVCFLASGKPAVVQHTGPSRFLPDAEGLLRFRSPSEAAALLEKAAEDYDVQAKAARALAAEHFEARKVALRILSTV